MPHAALQIPAGGPQAMEATAAKYREVLTRGAQRAQSARAQVDTGDAGRSSAEEAAQPSDEEEAGRGNEEHAA